MMALRLLLAAGALGWITSAHAGDLDVKPDSRIEILYLSANDCRYCRSWQLFTWKRFSQTPEAQYVRLIKVDRGSLRFSVSENDYPKEYRHLYQKAPGFGNTVPAWWVLLDGQPIMRSVGGSDWDSRVEPTLVQLVTKKLAGGGTLSSVGSPTP
jgi:hypothetical protein